MTYITWTPREVSTYLKSPIKYLLHKMHIPLPDIIRNGKYLPRRRRVLVPIQLDHLIHLGLHMLEKECFAPQQQSVSSDCLTNPLPTHTFPSPNSRK